MAFLEVRSVTTTFEKYVVLCAIWYNWHNLKKVKNTHGGVHALAYNFSKSNTPLWVFFTFLKMCTW